ncbi:MAG TPA: hypothetical protein VKG78_10550 [Opitutaceae bacterium]|nr:hypothetical protein [Opitutaceae bacterium]
MSPAAPLICLVTPGHVASTPRLVKEADALVDAGYRVHVVAGRHFAPADPLDADVLGPARWSCTRVSYDAGAGALARKVLRSFARRMVVHPRLATVRIAARASHAEALRLAAVAARRPAKLYIGHCLPGLPAAALAARACGAAYGFDAEDFHDAETEAAMNGPAERAAARELQERLLGGCSHLTAASPLIGRQYLGTYRVEPRTVLNVFPRSQAPASPADPGPVSDARPARIYWFSQTVGPGRGLESVVAILGRSRTPAELQLRGFPAAGYADHLQALALRAGMARPIRFLPPGPPTEMARLAADADLGVSSEEKLPPNRNLCLTNKVFVYLLAGIPQLLSNTAAQSALAPELGEAAILADLARPDAASEQLDRFFADPARVASARRAAWSLAQERYCWDVEKSRFLDSIRAVVPIP